MPSDLRRLNSMAVKAQSTGMVIVGGGVIKHHICNANLMVRTMDESTETHAACWGSVIAYGR